MEFFRRLPFPVMSFPGDFSPEQDGSGCVRMDPDLPWGFLLVGVNDKGFHDDVPTRMECSGRTYESARASHGIPPVDVDETITHSIEQVRH